MSDDFKSAEELGITENERTCLIKAQEILTDTRMGQPVQVPNDGVFLFNMNYERIDEGEYYAPTPLKDDAYTDMVHIGPLKDEPDAPYTCDSMGCIAGLCSLIADVDKINAFPFEGHGFSRAVSFSNPLYRLFYPTINGLDYEQVTPSTAAEATRHFLRGEDIEDFDWKVEAAEEVEEEEVEEEEVEEEVEEDEGWEETGSDDD